MAVPVQKKQPPIISIHKLFSSFKTPYWLGNNKYITGSVPVMHPVIYELIHMVVILLV